MKRWRVTYEHPFQHLVDDPQMARVANEVGPVLATTGDGERHVVSKNVVLTLRVLDRAERLVGFLALRRVRQLAVAELGTTDDRLLGLHALRAPGAHVVQILLDHNIAAAGIGRIFVAHDRRGGQVQAIGIRGAVDELQQVAPSK